jgi:transposase InsO family protein
MASVAEGNSEAEQGSNATSAPTYTINDIIKMTSSQLKTAIESFEVEPTGKRKRELQMQLIAIVTASSGQDELDQDDDEEMTSATSLAPETSPAATSHMQSSFTRTPTRDSHRPASSPIHVSDKESVELQIKLRQLELEAEERKLRLQAEIDERKSRFELEKQQLEREREFKYAELERQREREIRAHELALRQLEINNSGSNAAAAPDAHLSTFKVEAAVKLIPRFNENDIESFLRTFERIAQLNDWPEDKYAAVLQTHLSGKALKIFTELSTEQCQDYATLKAALLTAYSVVPEVYRKRFRTISKYTSETYSEFAFRLQMQFKRWTEGEDAYSDIEKMRELIQLEQFREGLDSELVIWLIDQKPKTLAEAARLADQFVAIRKSSNRMSNNATKAFYGNREKNAKVQSPQFSRKIDDGAISKDSNVNGSNSLSRNGKGSMQDQKRTGKEPKSFDKITCAYCKKSGHVISDCRKRLAKNATAETSVKEACIVSKQTGGQKKIDPGYRKHCTKGTLVRPNGKTKSIVLLRDTGALQSLVSKQTFAANDYIDTGEHRLIKAITGEILKVPLVKIRLKSKLVNAEVLCGLMRELPSGIDALIGNDLCPNDPVSLLAVTRAQTRALEAAQRTETDSATENPAISAIESDELDDELNLAQFFSHDQSIDRDKLIHLQRSDSDLKSLFALAETTPSENFKASRYFMKDGILMRSWHDKKAPGEADLQQIVAPKPLHAKLLCLAHDIPLAGHLGTAKTLSRLQQNFYWPTISKDTRNYCRTCDCCQRLGKGNKKTIAPLHNLPVVTEPFSQIAIDIIGPLTCCKDSKNRFILTILDLCTHYPEAIPLKEHTAAEVAQALITTFSRFGFPKSILSDLGSEFQSQLMQIFLHEYNISQIRTSVHHPMTDGACERFNGTLKSMLTAICDQYPYSWDTVLPWVLFAYREVPVETLGCSPFELLFGRSVSGPLSLIKSAWLNDCDLGASKQNIIDFIMETREKIRNAIHVATEHAKLERRKAKTYYDKRAREREFDIGDEVLVLLPVPAKPLHAKYYGPYKIVEKLGPVDYVVATHDRRKTKRVCHVNLLREYHRRDSDTLSATDGSHSVHIATVESQDDIQAQTGSLTKQQDDQEKLSPEHAQDIALLCQEFDAIFSDKPGKTHLCTHHIQLMPNAKPFRCVPYRMNPEKTSYLKNEIAKLLDQKLIAESQSSFASPIVLIPKANKSWRICTDLRKLNAQSLADPFPIPRVDDLIDRVGKAKYLSKIDMTQGFLQVPLDEESQSLTSFVTPFGQFEWKVMCFGLRNATATFSRLVANLLSGLEDFAAGYVDDILIFSNSWKEHLKHIRTVLTRIKNAGLTLNREKCTFAVAEIDYLGHRIGLGKVQPLERKVSVMLNFPKPTQRKQLQSFLGLHQKNYSTIEKEALALILAVRAFSVYFGSTPVRVYTDHNPLVFLQRMANHNQKLLRWSLELQHYNLEIFHRAGKDNLFPDLLSRPSEETMYNV